MASGTRKRKGTAMDSSVLENKAKKAMLDDKFQVAVDLYSQAIRADAVNADLFADRAQAYIKLQKFDEAVADADKAVQLNASLAKAHARRGYALSELAVKSLLAGVSLNPPRNRRLTPGPFVFPAPSSPDDDDLLPDEEVRQRLKAMKDKYLPHVTEQMVIYCRKFGKEKPEPKFRLPTLRAYLLGVMSYLNKDPLPPVSAKEMHLFERNLVDALSRDMRMHGL